MKKAKWAAVLCAIMLFIIGCGITSPEETIKKAGEKLDKADNFAMKMMLQVEGKQDNQTVKVEVSADAKVDLKNKTNDMTIKMDMGTMAITMHQYIVEENDQTTTYSQNLFGEGWTKSTEKTTAEDKGNFKDVLDIFDKGTNTKKVKSDIDGMTKYEMTINKEAVEKLLKSTSDMTSSQENVKVKGDLNVLVYTKDGAISKMVMDFLPALDIPDTTATITKYALTFEFSDINKTEVTIPSDVINNAKEETNGDIDEATAHQLMEAYAKAVEYAAVSYMNEYKEEPTDYIDYYDYIEWTSDNYVDCDDMDFSKNSSGKYEVTLKNCTIDFGDTTYNFENGKVITNS